MRAERTAPVLVVLVWALALAGIPAAGPAAAGQAGNLKTFCRTLVELTQLVAVEGAIPDEDAPPKKIAKFERRLAKLFNRAERAAPPEIVNDVSFASELTYLDVRESPDVLGIAEPIRAIKRFVADECGFKTVTVTAREYEFQGIPKTLRTGTVVFELRNEGSEVHQMAFGRIKGDASLEALLELPESERVRLNRIQELGLRALAAPAESDVALVTFTRPGRYAVADFVPVGTTSVEADTDGAPHTDEGMFAEFRVKKR
ncbi:MAG: hypothetical protein ACRDY6_12710 [Acidimicrobiia bacterium]